MWVTIHVGTEKNKKNRKNAKKWAFYGRTTPGITISDDNNFEHGIYQQQISAGQLPQQEVDW